MLLGVGEGFSPATSEFRVAVHGEQRSWTLLVAVRGSTSPPVAAGGDLPTRNFELELTPMQRRVVEAYVAPMRRGRLEPATHREVATTLSYHPNSAREALYEVWARMFAAGIPMPDVSEKRVAVAEAVLLHRLFDESDDADA